MHPVGLGCLQSERLHSSSYCRALPQPWKEPQHARIIWVGKDLPDDRIQRVTDPHLVTQTKALSAPSSLSLNTSKERSCCVFIYPQSSLLTYTTVGAWALRTALEQHHTWGGISVVAGPAAVPVPVADPPVPQGPGLCGQRGHRKETPTKAPARCRRLPL